MLRRGFFLHCVLPCVLGCVLTLSCFVLETPLCFGAGSSGASKSSSSSSGRQRRGNDCQKLIDEKIRANKLQAQKLESKGDLCEAAIHLKLARRSIDALDGVCAKTGQQESLQRYAKELDGKLESMAAKIKDCPEQKESGGASISKEDGVTIIKKK